MTGDGVAKAAQALTTAVLAVIIVGGAVAESIMKGGIDTSLQLMAMGVVGVFFTGQAIRSSNGVKMDAVATSLQGLHKRLDDAGIPPANDGSTGVPA